MASAMQNDELIVPGYDCGDCHGSAGWDVIDLSKFDHQQTGFQLKGAHMVQNCSQCHLGETIAQKHDFQLIADDCASCHLDIHETTLGNDCSACHNSDAWTVTQRSFDHKATLFPLFGAHRFADCQDCHQFEPVVNFDYSSVDCYSCHQQDYEQSTNPNHIAVRFNADCSQCHAVQQSTWISSFDHDLTIFPLAGLHKSVDCSGCHADENYTISSDCYDCHQQDYTQTTDPNHISVNISTDCKECHTEQLPLWASSFDHDLTVFPLLGLHKPVDCTGCHVDPNSSPSLDCNGCHLQDFETTQTPDHSTYNYPAEDCNACHSEFGWIPHTFMHDLTYSCGTCHQPDYDTAVDPPHTSASGFTLDCDLCHSSTTTWDGAVFDHSNATSGCVTCHLSDYQGASDPPHSEETGFSESCEQCHNSTTTWDGATFSHEDITTACNTCHMNDFYEEHSDGFPTDCENCHTSTTDWEEVSFSHDDLTDACSSCHMDDFYDEHSDGEPTDCETCHTTNNWDDVTFDHDNDYFPIYSGEHNNEWSTCTAECHINSSDYSVFSCGLNGVCHDHRQSEMDDEHDGETGYSYNSSACYDCHPNGEKDDNNDDFIDPTDWRNHLKRDPDWMQH
jgi:hypothetical protein